MKYKWLWFDLDNTLMDFDKGAILSFEKTVTHFGIQYSPQLFDDYRVISEACWLDLEKGVITIDELKKLRFQQFLTSINSKVDPYKMNNLYLKSLSESVIFYDGAYEFLESLKAKGFKLALITNGLKEVQRPKLKKANLLSTFECIAISGEIGFAKPDGQFFDFIYESAGNPAKEEILVIGDNLNSDIKGGIDFGVDTCWSNYAKKENMTNVQPTHTITFLQELNRIIE